MDEKKIEQMKDYIIEEMNKTGDSFDLVAILGLHFQKCEPCRLEYFKVMEEISLKIAKHIKETDS